MKTINLKNYYPCYTQDTFVEVPDELLVIFEEFAKAEVAYVLVVHELQASDG